MDTSLKALLLVLLSLSPIKAQRGQQAVLTGQAAPATTPWVATPASGSGTQVSTGGTMAITVTAGALVVATADNWTGTTPVITSITPNGGTCGAAFVKVAGGFISTYGESEIWAAPNCGSGVTSLTYNFTGGGNLICGGISVTNMPTTLITDGTNTSTGASGSGTNPTGPTVTTAKAGDLIVATYDAMNSLRLITGVSAGWTRTCPGCSNQGSAWLTSNSATAGSYAPTWTTSTGGWAAATAAFAQF